jgi:hypothetical protein
MLLSDPHHLPHLSGLGQQVAVLADQPLGPVCVIHRARTRLGAADHIQLITTA